MFGGFGGPSGPVDNDKFYELLELPKSCTTSDIKKAYRKAARVHHPDRGGDGEKFKEIQRAYEVLSDPEKRETYDKYGEEGLDGSGGGGGGMGDIFDLFGGGGRRGNSRRSRRKGEDVVFPLKVSLEDLYNGLTKKLRITKNVLCSDCGGKGGKGDAVKTCDPCRGQGVRLIIRQLGPGMIQQMQTTCSACQGQGQVIADEDRCKTCEGKRTVKERKTLEVFVRKGMKHGQRITFNGEADEAPDTDPGDVVVVLQRKEHPVFRREGAHLFMKKKISLVESLCGFSFKVSHLDRRVLIVSSTPGAVYRPGSFRAIMEQGMPMEKNPLTKGNLYIEFEVVFPEDNEIPTNTQKLLRKILPSPEFSDRKEEDEKAETHKRESEERQQRRNQGEEDDNDLTQDYSEERVSLVEVDMESEKQRFAEQSREAYEEDDEEHAHHGPGCRAQ